MSDMTSASFLDPPPITVDSASEAFFEAARQKRFVLPFCSACGRYEQPGATTCRGCHDDALDWKEASGEGVIYSFVIFHRSFHPAFAAPYGVCTIELAEGPRLIGAVHGLEPGELTCGLPVEIEFSKTMEPLESNRSQVPIHFRPKEATADRQQIQTEVSR